MGIGSRIEQIRGKLTRQEFAKRIGVGKTSVQNYEVKDLVPKGEVLLKLRNEFHVDIEWLLTGEGGPYCNVKEVVNGPNNSAQEITLGQAVDMVSEILSSGDALVIQNMTSNLQTLSALVRRNADHASDDEKVD